MTLLYLYCAFAYGYVFARVVDIITGNDIGCSIFASRYPLIAFFIAFLLFMFAPVTFIVGRLFGLFSIIFNKYEGDWI